MSKNEKHKNKYNHYSEAFRKEAVRRADAADTSAADVAKELGIHPGQIYNWRRQYKKLGEKEFKSMNGVDYSMNESEDVRRLKRENAALKEEIEFLKKATAYFAKEKQ
jgi:transposase